MAHPAPDRAAFLNHISQSFNSTLNLDDVLARVMDEAMAVARAARGFVMLRDPDARLVFRAARGMDQTFVETPGFQISRDLAERVATEGVPRLITDARVSEPRSILCAPLRTKDTAMGILCVDRSTHAGEFTPDDLEFLVQLAIHAALAIENAQTFHAVQSQLQNLRLLHEISADLTSTLDLERVLIACLRRVQNALRVGSATILTVEDGELVFQYAIGEKAEEIKPFRLKIGQGITGWVAQHAQGTFTNDWSNDPRRYSTVDQEIGHVTRSLLAAPLIVNDRVTGVISATNKPGGFTSADLDLLSTIGGSAAIAIENARLYQVAVEKGRLERELQVAREVQANLIPAETPKIPGWDIAALWEPAREVSGYFYDFVPLDENHLGIVIADVSDKGMPAALFMALARSIVRASIAPKRSPAESITQANRVISADSTYGMFVTIFYAQLDTVRGEMIYVNAGHNLPLVLRANKWIELERTGIAVAALDAFEFSERAVQFNPGDCFVLYTDGVTDATGANGEHFGEARLREVISANHHACADEIISALKEALHEFTGPAAQFDDITVVVVKREP